MGVPGPFCDIFKGPSHRLFILKMVFLSAIFHEQAHKVCVGQMSWLCMTNLTYIWPWNKGRGQILNINILTCVAMINQSIYKVNSHFTFLSYRHFKLEINKSALVWSRNLGQRSNLKTCLNSLGMTSYTLSILFFALKLKVKKLLSIEIVIFIFALSVA
jgi:hypothetical protein